MIVTVTVGRTTETLEIPSDLLARSNADHAQDITSARVSAAFVTAYMREVSRTREEDA